MHKPLHLCENGTASNDKSLHSLCGDCMHTKVQACTTQALAIDCLLFVCATVFTSFVMVAALTLSIASFGRLDSELSILADICRRTHLSHAGVGTEHIVLDHWNLHSCTQMRMHKLLDP